MRLKDNPFKILDVTPSDSVDIINQNAEDKAFTDDENERLYEDARITLLSPTKRIAAEIGWIYNRNVNTVLADIDNGCIDNLSNFDSLEKVNTLTETLYKCDSNQLFNVFVNLDQCYRDACESTFTIKILNKVNSARQMAGIPSCDDGSLIQNEIKQKLQEINSAINYLFEKFDDEDLIKITNLIAANTIEAGNEYGQVIDSLINQYAVHFSDDLSSQKQRILARIEVLKNNFKESELYNFCEDVRAFDNEAQPIQLFLQKSGQSKLQVESNEVAHAVRDFAVFLYGQNNIDAAITLINLGIEVFPELPDVFSVLSEDRKILLGLKARQVEFAAIERMIEEGWKHVQCDVKYADKNRQYLDKNAPNLKNCLDEKYNKYKTFTGNDNDKYLGGCMNCAYYYRQFGDMLTWGGLFIDAKEAFLRGKFFAEKCEDEELTGKINESIRMLDDLISRIGISYVPRLKTVNITNKTKATTYASTSSNTNVSNNDTGESKFSFKTVAIIAVVLFALYSLFSSNNPASNKDVSINKTNRSVAKQELNKNSVPYVVNKNEDIVDSNKSSGLNKTDLPFEPKLKGFITGTEVFMRSGPGKQYKGVGFLRKGETFEILDVKMEWVKVRTANSNVVWVFKQYCAVYPNEMPSSEMTLGGIVPLNTTLRDVKSMFGEPSDKKVYEGEGAHVVTYSYGSLFKVYGRTGIPRDKSLMLIENNIPVIGYSIKANNLSTRSGIRVGMPYQKVVDLYGIGRMFTENNKIISFFYSNKKLQTISFYVDSNGIIKEISVGQEW